MQSHISSQWPLLVVGGVGIVFCATSIFFLVGDTSAPPIKIAVPEQISSGLPTRLIIPAINVDATVEYVGLTSGGTMDVPRGPDDVAWFYLGPRPGDQGSAVIAGHYGWKNGISAVFDNLSTLQKGDRLYVEDKRGATATFVVRELRTYDPSADATEVFGSSDGKAHLNLITCEGVWDGTQRSYSNRLVVFTDKE